MLIPSDYGQKRSPRVGHCAFQQVAAGIYSRRSGQEQEMVRTIVKNLRGKLREEAGNPAYLFNEPKIGYRWGEGEKSEGSESQNAFQGRG